MYKSLTVSVYIVKSAVFMFDRKIILRFESRIISQEFDRSRRITFNKFERNLTSFILLNFGIFLVDFLHTIAKALNTFLYDLLCSTIKL